MNIYENRRCYWPVNIQVIINRYVMSKLAIDSVGVTP